MLLQESNRHLFCFGLFARRQERNTNRLRDFVAVAGPLGVTHFVILSRTDHGTNLRIARVPRGPTLSFQVKTYSLAKDIAAMQKSPKSPGSEFNLAPLLVLNNFGDSKELKLVSTVFQNMFPPINIQSVGAPHRAFDRLCQIFASPQPVSTHRSRC